MGAFRLCSATIALIPLRARVCVCAGCVIYHVGCNVQAAVSKYVVDLSCIKMMKYFPLFPQK